MAKALRARSLSERIRLARNLGDDDGKPLSARELDKLAGLRPGHTSAIEAGRRGNVEVRTAVKLATVLGVSLDWLASGYGEAPIRTHVRAAVRSARARAVVGGDETEATPPPPPASGPTLPAHAPDEDSDAA